MKNKLRSEADIIIAFDRAIANFSEIANDKNILKNRKSLKRLLLRVLSSLILQDVDVAQSCEVIEMALDDVNKWNSSIKSLVPDTINNILNIRMFRDDVLRFTRDFDLGLESFQHIVCGYMRDTYIK